MALYNRNSDLPGAKKILSSEAVAPQGSSNMIHLVQVAMDSANMQDTFDAYIECNVNTSTNNVKFTATADISANELAGQWAYVSFPTPEVRLIRSNDAALTAAECTVVVETPFSVAPSTGPLVNIRRWEDYHAPSFHGSVNEFLEKFVAKDTAGKFVLTNIHAAYHTLDSLFKNGARYAWVIPVPRGDSADDLVAALDPEFSADLVADLLALSPQPDIIASPKHPILTAGDDSVLDSAQWATVDAAWIAYVDGRATNSSNDESRRELVYVTDTGSASSSAAVTYVGTTVATTSERVFWVHGQYVTQGVTAGSVEILGPATAAAGVVNRVSNTAKESFGHAVFGERYTQLSGSLGLVEKITQANRLSLRQNGVNPFITKVGRGTYLESQYTGASSSVDSGLDPVEHLHVVVGRAKIWNTMQPVMESVIGEQNTAINRASVLTQIAGYMDNLVSQSIISGYDLADVTTSSDAQTGVARFELKALFVGAIEYVELKLVAAFAS